MRIADNETSAADLRSLGAEPVQRISSDDVLTLLKDHSIDGAETAPMFAVDNHYGEFAHRITGYALFDRVDTIVAARGAWKRLSRGQQAAVRAAAQDTIAFTRHYPIGTARIS